MRKTSFAICPNLSDNRFFTQKNAFHIFIIANCLDIFKQFDKFLHNFNFAGIVPHTKNIYIIKIKNIDIQIYFVIQYN